MRFAYLKYRLKKMGCYLLIIILLPYIITVFLSGPGAYGASRVDETMVNVKADGEKSGSDGGNRKILMLKMWIKFRCRSVNTVLELWPEKSLRFMRRKL